MWMRVALSKKEGTTLRTLLPCHVCQLAPPASTVDAAPGSRAGLRHQTGAGGGVRTRLPAASAPGQPQPRAVDFHVHSALDVFGRSLDDDEMAELAMRKQMGGSP